MRRIRLVVAVAAMLAMSVVLAVPAMADVRFNDDRQDRLDNRAENIEERLENRGYDVGDLDGEDLIWSWGSYDSGLLYYLD